MEPSYIVYTRTGVHKWYTTSNIVSKPYNPNLELIQWNLKDYGASWKITVAEVDNSEEYTYTEEVTTTYANNFEISGTIEKVGLKFGGSATTSNKSIFTVKTMKNSDPLGDAVLNFSDPIITNVEIVENRRGDITYYHTNEISTGWVSLGIEPKKKY